MSELVVHRCDRCKRFCDDEEAFASVTVLRGDEAGTPLDLCADCEDGLLLYVRGAKLARKRKAP
jgi:hypothetical protein